MYPRYPPTTPLVTPSPSPSEDPFPHPHPDMAQAAPHPIPTASNDFLRDAARPLQSIFAPRTVAVIGSTEKAGSVGRTVTWNLVRVEE